MKKTNIIILTILIALSINCNAEEYPSQLGLYGTYNIYQHSVNFGTLPSVPSCCPKYEDASGNGFSAGLFFKSPINDFLFWQIRAGYTHIAGDFKYDEYIGNALDINYNTTEAISEHNLKTTLGHIELIPAISIKPLDLPLFINIGVPFGIQLSSKYEQSERIKQPSNVFYLNGGKTRNISDGEIDDLTNPFISGMFSLNYEFKFGKFSISPEVSYYLGISDVISTREWKVNSFRFGLLFAYNFEKEKEVPVITQKPSELIVKLDAKGINKDNKEEEIVKFIVEEFLSRQLYPLLPYIFFRENSEEISERYTRLGPNDVENFDENKRFFNSEVMSVYYDVMNIIGKRMLDNPSSTITITGYNSNQRQEKNNLKLAQGRAEKVRDYLRDRWGIQENRMIVKWDNLPQKPTRGDTKDHFEENQRVEIYSDDYNIIKPVFVYDTLRLTSPPKMKVTTDIITDDKVVRWNLQSSQFDYSGEKNIFFKNGYDYSPEDKSVIWDFSSEKKSIPRTETPINLAFEVETANQMVAKAYDTIPVEQLTIQKKRTRRIDDKEIDEYRLIMFDFDTPDVLEAHKKIIELICENTKPNSTIYIEGYTDRLGSEEYNLKLSNQRAETMSSAIPCSVAQVNKNGMGEQQLYNNDVPEGRFYNRTVIIRVETPISNK